SNSHFSINLPNLPAAPPHNMSKTTASAAESPHNGFETPTLDTESPTLLHSISEHGGYAYVRMASLAASGDVRAAEAVREMAWEQLHSGPWHSVLPVWRDAYSMACLHVAKHHYGNGEFKEALRALDMGIIMGGNLLRKDLDSAIGKVSEKARNLRVSDRSCQDFGSDDHRLVDLDFDVSKVLQLLPVKSLASKLVVKRSALSLEKFLKDHYLSGSPVIISDCMAHWPAKKNWNNKDYLLRVAGDRTVPVELVSDDLTPTHPSSVTIPSRFCFSHQVVELEMHEIKVERFASYGCECYL
ncbi:Lysine-specific demethylase jmj30, variant 3, partial [Lathyrus oleraceus]